MRKHLLLCLVLIVPILCYSQDTLRITSEQLKITNLIFAEHKKYSQTIPLLEKQISNLLLINKSWEKTDSINRINYQTRLQIKDKAIKNLEKSLKQKQDIIKYSTISSCVLVILCLLIK